MRREWQKMDLTWSNQEHDGWSNTRTYIYICICYIYIDWNYKMCILWLIKTTTFAIIKNAEMRNNNGDLSGFGCAICCTKLEFTRHTCRFYPKSRTAFHLKEWFMTSGYRDFFLMNSHAWVKSPTGFVWKWDTARSLVIICFFPIPSGNFGVYLILRNKKIWPSPHFIPLIPVNPINILVNIMVISISHWNAWEVWGLTSVKTGFPYSR